MRAQSGTGLGFMCRPLSGLGVFPWAFLLLAMPVRMAQAQAPAPADHPPPRPQAQTPASSDNPAPRPAQQAPAPAAKPAAPSQQQAPATPDPRAQQQAAMAAMQESLAKQRAAIQKQIGQSQSRGFFVLAPPAAMGPVTLLAPDCEPLPDVEIDALIGKAATSASVDPVLVRSVMKTESAFRPCAVSPKGAMGLMQLMPATAEDLGVHNIFDPVENVDAGARLLKQLWVRYSGDLPKVLAAYNAGPSTVDQANGVPAIPETVDYIQRILSLIPKM